MQKIIWTKREWTYMIRFASEADIPAIMKFIDENWRKNHVLSRNRELFEFQHRWGDEITYVLSKKDGLITGILGYIPYGSSNRDALLTTWKAIKTEDTMQGIRLLTYLRENGNVRSVASPGINPKTISIYKFLNFRK